jgi:hypothetical protein
VKAAPLPLRALIAMLAMGLLLTAAGTAAAGQSATTLERCGKVSDAGGRSPVSSANIRCHRARAIARDFIHDDFVRPRWKAVNPAGCEWLMFRKHDRHAFHAWNEDSGALNFPLIGLVKQRGCAS